MLSFFQEAVSNHGLPSRVRCDKGGENYDVGQFMLDHPERGPGRGSIIAGDAYFFHSFTFTLPYGLKEYKSNLAH